ncbi:hypothetical protein Tsubulata_000294 [Turnera subulata]|uniref:J domain-containing protein n=1 Tax=Turnera subulata TaxID=218843 RepID=A0A9Q0F1N2_9ROSI|nr:hypothetical protein Tsubulata_000294 [Turnera subulata]
MEKTLSHSRQPSSVFSKKTSYNGGAAAKTVYDDVFGGPPRFGAPSLSPRVEEYSEIFGGFHAPRASSIPVLDLPVVGEDSEVFFDVRSCPGFDYNEVFGGFGGGQDFAVSYEELVMAASAAREKPSGVCSSDEEAWTLEDAECLSVESTEHCLSNGDTHEPIDGCMEFNISYHKASRSIDEVAPNGITHVTQLVDVPGYAYMVDRTTSLPKAVDEYSSEASDDGHLSIDLSGEMTTGRHLGKTMSHPANGNSGRPLSGNDIRPQKALARNGSHPSVGFVTISDVSLRTQPSHLPAPSRPPPPLDVKNRVSGELTSNCASVASGGTAGDSSPPYFDVEVDASSSAAVSAAAMKEAMEQAQAKLKSAKELMERKKDVLQSRSKSSAKNDRKGKEEKKVKIVDGLGCRENQGQSTSLTENGLEYSVLEERHQAFVSAHIIPDTLEEVKHPNNATKFGEKHGSESFLIEDSRRIDGAGEWKEATGFFELVKTESRKALDQPNNENIWVQNINIHEQEKKGKKILKETVQQDGERKKKVKKVRGDHVFEDCEKKSRVSKEADEVKESFGRAEAGEVPRRQKGLENKAQAGEGEFTREENKKNFRTDHQAVGTEKKHSRLDVIENHENLHTGSKSSAKPVMKCKEKDPRPKEVNSSMQDAERVSIERENNEDRQKVISEKENDWKVKFALEQAENERRLKESLEKEEQRMKEAYEREENEKRQKEAYQKEENEKKLREALECEESERRQKEALEKEENKRRQREAAEREANEKREKEAREREHEKQLKEALAKEENERRQKEAVRQEEYNKGQREACERDVRERKLQEDLALEEERKQRDARERGGTVRRSEETSVGKEFTKVVEEAPVREETRKRPEETSIRKEFNKGVEEAPGREETRKRPEETCEQDRSSRLRWAVEEEVIEMEIKGACEEEEIHEACEWPEIEVKLKNASKSDGLKGLKMVGKDFTVLSQPCKLDDNVKNSKHGVVGGKLKANVGTAHEEIEEVQSEPGISHTEATVKTVYEPLDREPKAFGMVDASHECKKEGDGEEVPCADVGVKTAVVSGNDACNNEETKSASHLDFEMRREKDKNNGDDTMPRRVPQESVETGRKMGATQPVSLQMKGSTHKTTQQLNASQNTEKKMKNVGGSAEEKEKERVRREEELEKERLRKIEEEREREREREKDRMAVDRATLEARDRAYTEARERAERTALERATAEARQRALNEARERLEKACAEAREKSQADKAAAEARIRAERAAVERATAEARERAFEKAMAERAAFGARERMERSVSDKFSGSSRTSGMRPSSSSSDLQFQSAGSFNGSRYTHSSLHSNSSYTERSEEIEGESAQRCKARLERHRRTAERAAKALAEKNMRDLLAQREQAERNRLAETLDAEVKRWSSGKEGNLRALLSTLQYILGPGSGWQPIPLTEVITSAAVKKAYRKATLCVHPDKLQQRGASIQHKYICEKVFDLLKEAWNKFNSEER